MYVILEQKQSPRRTFGNENVKLQLSNNSLISEGLELNGLALSNITE